MACTLFSQAWNFIFGRAIQFAKGTSNDKSESQWETFWRGTKAKTRGNGGNGLRGLGVIPDLIYTEASTAPIREVYQAWQKVLIFHVFDCYIQGWDDIAYNFLIGGDEKVYIGRGWDTVGAHAGSTYYNSHSIGTSIIGNYNDILV